MRNLLTRKLTATWTLDDSEIPPRPIDISKLTEEEQADLIISKLTNPPVKKTTVDDIIEKLSAEIADAIDRELFQELMDDSDDI